MKLRKAVKFFCEGNRFCDEVAIDLINLMMKKERNITLEFLNKYKNAPANKRYFLVIPKTSVDYVALKGIHEELSTKRFSDSNEKHEFLLHVANIINVAIFSLKEIKQLGAVEHSKGANNI